MLPAVDEVCVRFGLGDPVSVTDAGGTRNVSFIVQTDRGKWVLRRRYPGYCDAERIAFDHSAACFLEARGVPVIAPRASAECTTCWDSGSGIWEVYAFAEGRHLRDGEREDAIVLAGSLARLHEAGSLFTGRYEKLGPRGEADPDHLVESIERARADTPNAGELLDSHKKVLLRAASELSTEQYLALPHTLVHGDVQPANIIMEGGRVKAFLDMDWCAWRPRIYDLCFALICCCARHERPLAGGDVWDLTQSPDLDPVTAREFLEVYGRCSAPLSEAETNALGPQLALTWLHMRIDNCFKLPADKRLAFLERECDLQAIALGMSNFFL